MCVCTSHEILSCLPPLGHPSSDKEISTHTLYACTFLQTQLPLCYRALMMPTLRTWKLALANVIVMSSVCLASSVSSAHMASPFPGARVQVSINTGIVCLNVLVRASPSVLRLSANPFLSLPFFLRRRSGLGLLLRKYVIL